MKQLVIGLLIGVSINATWAQCEQTMADRIADLEHKVEILNNRSLAAEERLDSLADYLGNRKCRRK